MAWNRILTNVSKLRQLLHVGYDDTIQTKNAISDQTKEGRCIDGSQNGQGYRMPRNGSVTAASFQCDIASDSGQECRVTMKIMKNDSQIFTLLLDDPANGDKGASRTYAAGTYSFVADDRIGVDWFLEKVNTGDTVKYVKVRNISGLIEIET
tara:strand:- start:89 stop:544 length:456 start_codon:yes stop_codon:yes gene_type:complete